MTPQLASRVLFVSGQDGGTRRYRCYHPQEQLEQLGIAAGFREAACFRLLADALDYDIFILHRVPYTDLIGQLLELAHQRGKMALFETDDLIFEPDLVQYDGYYRSLPLIEAPEYVRKVYRHLKTLERCDYALTTTGYLAKALRRHHQRVFISRNALSSEFVRLAEEARRHKVKRPDDRVVLGYVSGSTSHDQDFMTVSNALLHIMNKYPQVELRIIGSLNLGERFAPVQQRIRTTPLIPWQDVPRESQTIDINLAPLEQDNPFCQSKSEVKYIEAGILGIPTVASRTEAFEFAIRPGETSFLANDTHEWIECLELLIRDPDRRIAVGEAARSDVLQNYTPHVRGQQFSQLLQDFMTQHQPDSVLEQEQIERRVIAHLSDILGELTLPHDSSDPPRPLDDTLWRRRYLSEGRDELVALAQRRRRLLTWLQNRAGQAMRLARGLAGTRQA